MSIYPQAGRDAQQLLKVTRMRRASQPPLVYPGSAFSGYGLAKDTLIKGAVKNSLVFIDMHLTSEANCERQPIHSHTPLTEVIANHIG